MGGGFRPLLSEAGVRDRGRVTTRSRAGHGLAHTRAGPAHGAAPGASARRSPGRHSRPRAFKWGPRRPAQGADFRLGAPAPSPGIFPSRAASARCERDARFCSCGLPTGRRRPLRLALCKRSALLHLIAPYCVASQGPAPRERGRVPFRTAWLCCAWLFWAFRIVCQGAAYGEDQGGFGELASGQVEMLGGGAA